jgi:epoxyqueuosine reductase QueG
MALTSEEAKQFTLKEGAELVGIAAADTFPPSVPPRPPQRLLPKARSVVVYGIPMLLGSISSNSRVATTHTKTVYYELDRISYQVGRLLEREGYRAATVGAFGPTEMSKETKGMVGDLSFRHAAVAAGLGVWSRCRIVLNAKWGPRVRYAAVVTDAPLAADSPLEQELCSDCNLCITACPVGALSPDGTVNTIKCLLHLQPYGQPGLTRFLRDLVAKPVEEQQQALREPLFWGLYQHLAHGIDYECSACLEACPVGL